MSGAQDFSSKNNKVEEEENEAEVGRKFHFSMKPSDVLEPAYFNKKT